MGILGGSADPRARLGGLPPPQVSDMARHTRQFVGRTRGRTRPQARGEERFGCSLSTTASKRSNASVEWRWNSPVRKPIVNGSYLRTADGRSRRGRNEPALNYVPIRAIRKDG